MIGLNPHDWLDEEQIEKLQENAGLGEEFELLAVEESDKTAESVFIGPSANLSGKAIDVIRRVAGQDELDPDMELVAMPIDIMDFCRRLSNNDRPDLTAEQVLVDLALHGAKQSEEALSIIQWVEMQDPTRDAQSIIDGLFESELGVSQCVNCGAIIAEDRANIEAESWRCPECEQWTKSVTDGGEVQ